MRRQEQAMKMMGYSDAVACGPLLPEWKPENPFVCMPPPRFQSDSPVNHFSEERVLYQRDDVAPHDR